MSREARTETVNKGRWAGTEGWRPKIAKDTFYIGEEEQIWKVFKKSLEGVGRIIQAIRYCRYSISIRSRFWKERARVIGDQEIYTKRVGVYERSG